jgi:hypothetical protein
MVFFHECDEIVGGKGVDGQPENDHSESDDHDIDGQKFDDQVALQFLCPVNS